MAGHNGWKNYETWLVALWIDNDYGSHQMRCEMTQEAFEAALGDDMDERKDNARGSLATSLQNWIEDMNPLAGDNGLYADLFLVALRKVDWREIADDFLTDVEVKD